MERSQGDPRSRPADWPHYLEAVLHFGDPVGWSIPARRFRIDAASSLAAMDFVEPFAVITAFHPYPHRLDRDENLARHARLRTELLERGLRAVPCAGSSADGTHREDGFAIACPHEMAVELACRFGQAAFYWWDGVDLWIEPATARFIRARIGTGSAT
ncbi:MAG: DUF3293 domain-containing protein [Phycisphaerales bacterium]